MALAVHNSRDSISDIEHRHTYLPLISHAQATSLGKPFYFSGNQSGRHARHERAGSVHHRKAILPVTKVAERNMSGGVIGIWGDRGRRKRKRIFHCRKRRLPLGTLHLLLLQIPISTLEQAWSHMRWETKAWFRS